jgi:hypothetical protein
MGFLASMFGMGGKGFGDPGDLTMLMNQRSAAGQAASMAPPPQSVAPVAPPMPTVRPVTAPPAPVVPKPRERPAPPTETTPPAPPTSTAYSP